MSKNVLFGHPILGRIIGTYPNKYFDFFLCNLVSINIVWPGLLSYISQIMDSNLITRAVTVVYMLLLH